MLHLGEEVNNGFHWSSGKSANVSQWYTEVLTKAEFLDYYNISGCYIMRPWSYRIWEEIQKFLDEKIKASGVEPCYFPIFVSQRALETETKHLEDFSPEVAW